MYVCCKMMNISSIGNIPDYEVVYPSMKKVSGKGKRDEGDNSDDHYIIEGLPISNMTVKLEHNTKLHSNM